MRQHRILIVALLQLLPGIVCGDVTVNVDAHTNLVLGRQDSIDGNLLGITAFQGFPSVIADRDLRARVAALRPGCFRFPGSVSWFAPKEDDLAWYNSDRAKREFETTLLFGARYPYGRFVPVVRAMGAECMVSLGGPPAYLKQEGTANPSDFDKWADYCAAYVGLWKQFAPELRLVQIWNEPNASWYNDPRTKDADISATELHIQMANKVGRAIKSRFADIQVGGPVLCWPPGWPPNQKGQRPWYTFDSWTRPWLDQTKDAVDFFDFHVYDVAVDDFIVQAEMVWNEAQILQQRHLPIWITESGYRLLEAEREDPAAIWQKRMLPYERLLLRGILPQTDKIAGNLIHDLSAGHFRAIGGDPFNVDPTYWLLWILRDLRGMRLVAESSAPDVLAYATMEEDRVTVVLFNDSKSSQVVDLNVSMPTGYWTGPRVRAIGQSVSGACERKSLDVSLSRSGGKASGKIEVPAFATVSLNFHMQNFGRTSHSRVIREFSGNKTLQFLKHSEPVSVGIDLPQTHVGEAVLRVGLLGPDGGESFQATFNDVPIALKPIAFQEIPLDSKFLKTRNTLILSLAEPTDNPRLALGFTSIVLKTRQ